MRATTSAPTWSVQALSTFVVTMTAACGSSASSPDAPDAPDAPPADATTEPAAVRVLPLGDSLTLGYGSATAGAGTEAGYRARLVTLLLEAEIPFDLVGAQSHGPDALVDRDHEGHNGNVVAQIAEHAAAATSSYAPDVVLLMAGTNDQIDFVPGSQPPEGAAEDLEALIEQLEDAAPGVQIIVAQLIPMTLNDEGIVAYNALIPGIVERQRERGVHVRMVDMYGIGVDALSSDGIHPTLAGYDAIADIWFPALTAAIAELRAP
jgi:lysophospholipase L1-like esterase